MAYDPVLSAMISPEDTTASLGAAGQEWSISQEVQKWSLAAGRAAFQQRQFLTELQTAGSV